jgi:repressor LexA
MFGFDPRLRYAQFVQQFERKPVARNPSLTDRQQQVLSFIRETVAERGYPPSVREIGEAIGLASPSTVHSHLTSLVKAGYLRRDPSKPRAIEVLGSQTKAKSAAASTRPVPILGRIAAGAPLLATEEVEQVLSLPTALVGRGQVFMLRVKGDSMIDAGILDGDLVVIEHGAEARDGEIVAALVEGEEATVKKLRRKGGKVTLEPANPALSPVTYDGGVDIIGRVNNVIRTL